MANTNARTDINIEEFRKLLTTYKTELAALHNKQRAGTLPAKTRSDSPPTNRHTPVQILPPKMGIPELHG